MQEDKITSIRVRQSTRDALASLGDYGDSMDNILRKVLQAYDNSITFDDYK